MSTNVERFIYNLYDPTASKFSPYDILILSLSIGVLRNGSNEEILLLVGLSPDQSGLLVAARQLSVFRDGHFLFRVSDK
jgi:hypothetical protein